jgi:hypothetical protein
LSEFSEKSHEVEEIGKRSDNVYDFVQKHLNTIEKRLNQNKNSAPLIVNPENFITTTQFSAVSLSIANLESALQAVQSVNKERDFTEELLSKVKGSHISTGVV